MLLSRSIMPAYKPMPALGAGRLPRFGEAPVSCVMPGLPEPPSFPGLQAAQGNLWMPNGVKQPVQTYRSPNGNPLTLFTLSNGHRILVEQRPSDCIGIRTFVDTGSVIEDAVKPSPLYNNIGLPSGITHLDEHLHLTSTQSLPQKNGIAEALSQLGTHSNATTDDEMVQHELFFNREDLEQSLRLHADSVLRPLLNPAEINQEKDNVWNENSFRLGEVPYKLQDKFNELMFDRPGKQTIGTYQNLMGTTPEDIRRFRNQAYVPGNLLTIVTGNVNPQQVYNILAPEFLSNPVRQVPAGNTALHLALKPNEVRVATVTDPRISTGIVHFGFPAPPLTNYRDRMAMEFLTQMLAGSSLSVLDKDLIDEKKLASQIGAYYAPCKETGVCKIMLDTPLGKEREAASELLTRVASFANHPIPPDEVEKTRQLLLQRFRSRLDTTEEASHFMGSEALNNALPYLLHYEQLANLVTPQDLQEAALKYFAPKPIGQNYGVPNRYALVYGLPCVQSLGGANAS